jgi:hypothetical protein
MKKGFLLPSKKEVYWKGGGGLALPMIQIGNIFYDLRTEGLKIEANSEFYLSFETNESICCLCTKQHDKLDYAVVWCNNKHIIGKECFISWFKTHKCCPVCHDLCNHAIVF